MNHLRRAALTLMLIALGCSRFRDRTHQTNAHKSDTAVALSADSLFLLVSAYYHKQVSADVAAKALVDYVQQTGHSLNLTMDEDLRRAFERERRARGNN